MDDIRSLHRTVKVELFRPNFSRMYVVNLGSADPPGRLNWNRTVFVEAENDAGDYHAFVYAFVQKNRRGFELEDERILLGFAPLEKLENANGQQMPKFTEYKLSIPVNLNRFFKHKIWFLDIDIYQYEEDKMKSSSVGDEAEKDCSICLDEITKEQFCIKLHGENANHIFHRNCINKWFSLLDRLRCPLCNQQPNRVLVEGIVENGIIKHIRESLEEIVRNQENSQQIKNKALNAIIIIQAIKNDLDIFANLAIENLNILREEEQSAGQN
ncbi:hypothetical protein niasHS_017934 [Heterodera schachtii]|uniref:RING-type domain-containing protein n=1 Tax=Heterodera schachtii TaxID=97005 RepID=A0ABD2I6Y6_HETSC